MYRILLVDDEILVRDAIRENIDWKAMDCELVGDCDNGKAAAEFVQTHPVDIVLTDILMPYMDGMELSRFLHDNYPDIVIVIFSGFGEFEYAKKAIQYDVSEYMLKPVTAMELRAVIEKMKKKVVIIGAMPSELVDIRAALPNSEIVKKAGFSYYVNELETVTVIHVCSGIAKVNVAVCAQAAIDAFQPDAVINAGIAGGMQQAVKVCDIVISNEVLPHDLDLHFLKDYQPYCGIYPSDPHLMQLAAQVCEKQGVTHHLGRIVSGQMCKFR